MANFQTDIFTQFDKEWALVTAGTPEHHNGMTISWGGMGTLWGKPVVTVYVKPCRYTYDFLNQYDQFTVSFYPETCREALSLMGTLSGRDTDKEAQAGLNVCPIGDSVTFQEAEKTILCKKIYWQDLDLAQIPQEAAQRHYQTEAPHRMFIGEVLEIR